MYQQYYGQHDGEGQEINQDDADCKPAAREAQVDVEEAGAGVAEVVNQVQQNRRKDRLQDKNIHKQGVHDAMGQQHGAGQIVYAAQQELRLTVAPCKVYAVA